jgi:nucleotide-binding universal stress UspA family protein
MLTLSKILFPIDFSDRCDGAAHYVEALARQFGAEVLIVHVIPPPRYEFTSMEMGGYAVAEWYEAEKQAVCKKLQGYLKDEWAHLKVSRQLLEGAPAQTLLEFAHQVGADLMVMPTHGYGTFHRLVLGSTAATVLNHAECPVFTGVHMEEAPVVEDVRFRRIVVALDLNPSNRAALQWAVEFADNRRLRWWPMRRNCSMRTSW